MGDVTEPQFYKAWPASVGLFAGAVLAWRASRGGLHRRPAGQPICYGTGLWPWVLASASTSLALSNVFAGALLRTSWQPTFVPFVSVAAAVVLVYGPGWRVAATGVVLGVSTTPLAITLIDHVCDPLGLPAVVACTASMSVGGLLSFMVCRRLPWLALPRAGERRPTPVLPSTLVRDAAWTFRRVLIDFSEAQFYANEWATLGLLGGLAATVLLNPEFAAYGSGAVPSILVAQALTSAVGVVLWRRHYRAGGWAPTFVPLVSVAPAAVLAHPGSASAVLLGALAGAALGPPVARAVSARLPADCHPFVGNTFSMALCTALVLPALELAL